MPALFTLKKKRVSRLFLKIYTKKFLHSDWLRAVQKIVNSVQKEVTNQAFLLGGVYMRKLAPARVSHWDDFLISYRVYIMTGSFHI